jgi:hypothetical protein
VFPNPGPISQPSTVELNVAMTMPMTGSVGITLVMLSARAGTSVKAYKAAPVDPRDVKIEDTSAYRRRTVRIRKKVFQSRVEEDWEALEAGDAVVEAFLVRHSEGVKNDEGVDGLGGDAAGEGNCAFRFG